VALVTIWLSGGERGNLKVGLYFACIGLLALCLSSFQPRLEALPVKPTQVVKTRLVRYHAVFTVSFYPGFSEAYAVLHLAILTIQLSANRAPDTLNFAVKQKKVS
jgi:hypothetical protein